MTPNSKDNAVMPLVSRVLLTALVLAVVMEALALLMHQGETLISIAAGMVMAMASFVVLVAVVVRSLSIQCGPAVVRRQPLALVATVGCLKLVLLSVVLWWLISRQHVHPLPFLAGFSTMIVALLIEGLRLRGSPRSLRSR